MVGRGGLPRVVDRAGDKGAPEAVGVEAPADEDQPVLAGLCMDEGALSFVTAICFPMEILHTNENWEV
jgi:hypothetical protein